MRFMMFMYPEIEEKEWPGGESESSVTPEMFAAMSRYNEELRRAGMLLALDGLHPPGSDGATVAFDADGATTVTDGPFAETKEVVGGYWVIQARSRDEAVEWAKRCPCQDCRIELRRVQEMEEFPPEIREAAEAGAGE
jgi:hypothetical protein